MPLNTYKAVRGFFTFVLGQLTTILCSHFCRQSERTAKATVIDQHEHTNVCKQAAAAAKAAAAEAAAAGAAAFCYEI